MHVSKKTNKLGYEMDYFYKRWVMHKVGTCSCRSVFENVNLLVFRLKKLPEKHTQTLSSSLVCCLRICFGNTINKEMPPLCPWRANMTVETVIFFQLFWVLFSVTFANNWFTKCCTNFETISCANFETISCAEWNKNSTKIKIHYSCSWYFNMEEYYISRTFASI